MYINFLALTFNELCMNDEKSKPVCFSIQEDMEMLEFYNYDIISVVKENYKKYIGPLFTKE